MSLQHWPETERPREKLLKLGAASLSEAELLAILLQTGTPGSSALDMARGLLSEFRSLRWLLTAEHQALCRVRGLGDAVRGGVGFAKTAANYAASLLPAKKAEAAGYDQVLWLDGVNLEYVEEVGSMNIFFKYKDRLVTSQLNGSILPGITRDSVMQIARSWGLQVDEEKISIQGLCEDIEAGRVEEIFGSGTAAVAGGQANATCSFTYAAPTAANTAPVVSGVTITGC